MVEFSNRCTLAEWAVLRASSRFYKERDVDSPTAAPVFIYSVKPRLANGDLLLGTREMTRAALTHPTECFELKVLRFHKIILDREVHFQHRLYNPYGSVLLGQ
jgi:hypothetical protein